MKENLTNTFSTDHAYIYASAKRVLFGCAHFACFMLLQSEM